MSSSNSTYFRRPLYLYFCRKTATLRSGVSLSSKYSDTPKPKLRSLAASKVNNMLYTLKGTVSVIPRDPQCNDGNSRFTIVPLIALYDDV